MVRKIREKKLNFHLVFQALEDETSNIQWEIDFFPRGIRYSRAQLINVYNMPLHHQGNVEVPETILRTVRVRCTCKANLYDEQRFKVGWSHWFFISSLSVFSFQIAVLVSGSQNNVTHIKTLHTRTSYFSRENRVINIDNLVPYDELSMDRSLYLIGKDHDTVKISVIITPMTQGLAQDQPSFEFKWDLLPYLICGCIIFVFFIIM